MADNRDNKVVLHFDQKNAGKNKSHQGLVEKLVFECLDRECPFSRDEKGGDYDEKVLLQIKNAQFQAIDVT